MVKSMLSQGIPIHGIGFQAHLSLNQSMISVVSCMIICIGHSNIRDFLFCQGEGYSTDVKASPCPPYLEIAANVKRFANLGLEVNTHYVSQICILNHLFSGALHRIRRQPERLYRVRRRKTCKTSRYLHTCSQSLSKH